MTKPERMGGMAVGPRPEQKRYDQISRGESKEIEKVRLPTSWKVDFEERIGLGKGKAKANTSTNAKVRTKKLQRMDLWADSHTPGRRAP